MPKKITPMRLIARNLRQRQTNSEDMLWKALRDRQLMTHKFRRQHPIGQFVVDFFCPEARVAVEIDGAIHDFQQAADAERQRLIEALGVRFVRVSAEEVETDLMSVLEKIRAALKR